MRRITRNLGWLVRRASLAAVRKGVQALDDFAGAPMGSAAQISRNAHLWDRT